MSDDQEDEADAYFTSLDYAFETFGAIEEAQPLPGAKIHKRRQSMKVLGVITWFCLSSIVSALVQAWTMTKLWAWFVSLEYGPGPSMGAWFGIMTILGLVIGMALLAQADTTKKSSQDESLEDVIKRSIYTAVGKWAACFLVLAISWVTGSVLGWVR